MLDDKLSAFEHFCRHQGEKIFAATRLSEGKESLQSRTPAEILKQAWNRTSEDQKDIYGYCASLSFQPAMDKGLVSPYDEKESDVLNPHDDSHVDQLSETDSNEIHNKCQNLHVSNLKSARSEASSPRTAAVSCLDVQDRLMNQTDGPNGLSRGLLYRHSTRKLTDYWTALGVVVDGHNERKKATYESSLHPSTESNSQIAGSLAKADAITAFDFFVLDYCSAWKHPEANNMAVATAWEYLGEIERQKYEILRDEALARRELEENGETLTTRKLRRTTRILKTKTLPLRTKKRKSIDHRNSRKRTSPSKRCECSTEVSISCHEIACPKVYSALWNGDGESKGSLLKHRASQAKAVETAVSSTRNKISSPTKYSFHLEGDGESVMCCLQPGKNLPDDRCAETEILPIEKTTLATECDAFFLQSSSHCTSTTSLTMGHAKEANTVLDSEGIGTSISTDDVAISMDKSTLIDKDVNSFARLCAQSEEMITNIAKDANTTEINKQSLLSVTQANTKMKDPGNKKRCTVADTSVYSTGNNKNAGPLGSSLASVYETTQDHCDGPSISLEESLDPPLLTILEKVVDVNPAIDTIAANGESPPQLCERTNCTFNSGGASKNLVWDDEYHRLASENALTLRLEGNHYGDEILDKFSVRDDKKLLGDKTSTLTMESNISNRKKDGKENFQKCDILMPSTTEVQFQRITVPVNTPRTQASKNTVPAPLATCSDEFSKKMQQPSSSIQPAIDGSTVSTNFGPTYSNTSDDDDDDNLDLDELAIMTSDVDDGGLCSEINFGDELDVNAVVKLNCHELRQLLHVKTDDCGLFLQ